MERFSGCLRYLLVTWLACCATIGRSVTIDTDLTSGTARWDRTDQPYLLPADITVEAGATLVVGPGVTIQFGEGADLEVEGRIIAHATAAAPITFTGSTKEPGFWGRVRIIGTAEAINEGSSFLHCVFEYGGHDLTTTGYMGGTLEASYAAVAAEHCVIRFSGQSGAYATEASSFAMGRCHFADNRGYAVFLMLNALPASDGVANRDPELRLLTGERNGRGGIGIAEAFPLDIDRYTIEECGLDYHFETPLSLVEGARLVVEPGVTLRFAEDAGLMLQGPLIAEGTADHPIVLTGDEPVAGSWDGVELNGIMTLDLTNPPFISWIMNEGSRLSHTTIEFGGGGLANLALDHAKAALDHCTIRQSARHGIRHVDSGGSVVQRSRIHDNAQGGVYRAAGDEGSIIAVNNWWGTADGPYHKTLNPTGTGNAVSEGAASILPFLTAAEQTENPVAAPDILSLTATPHRWFIPADGMAHLTSVTLTIHDGGGNPVAGRMLRLDATHGSVVDGGITDIRGETTAYVYADSTGEASLTPRIEPAGVFVTRAQSASVTYTEPDTSLNLLPDAESPYVNRNLEIGPLPIEVGRPVTITARLVNRSALAVTAHVNFVKHNFGIGLPLEILGTRDMQVPAHADRATSVVWMPLSPGHQCLGLTGSFAAPGGASAKLSDAQFELPWLHNTNPVPAPLVPGGIKNSTDNVNKAMEQFNSVVSNLNMIFDPGGYSAGFASGALQGSMLDMLLGRTMKMFEEAMKALQLDPPRQDFRVMTRPESIVLPTLGAGGGISQRRAEAVNALMESQVRLMSTLRAGALALDRYAGAIQAGERQWADQQANNFIAMLREARQPLFETASRMAAFVTVLRNESVTAARIDSARCRALQQRLASTGFNADELQAAALLGMTAEEHERYRQSILAIDPDALAHVNLLDELENIADRMRMMYMALDAMDSVAGGVRNLGGAGLAAEPTRLVALYQAEQTFELCNPLSTAAEITFKIRRMNTPSDWLVQIYPPRLTLQPGERRTISVIIGAGAPTPQGITPGMAIEAYAGAQLLGGVLFEPRVPYLVPNIVDHLLGRQSEFAENQALIDYNGDGRVDIADLVYLINR